MKKIFIFDPSGELTILNDAFEELRGKGFDLKKTPCRVLLAKWIDPEKKAHRLVMLILMPLFFFSSLAAMACLKYKNKASGIIMVEPGHKILLTPAASLLNLDCYWMEKPNEKYDFGFRRLYAKLSKKAEVLAFSSFSKTKLEKAGLEKNINVIDLGIRTRNHQRQENIFSSLAEADREWTRKRFFTIGTWNDFQSEENGLEQLLRSVKIATSVIPNLQIIVIGDGPERKKGQWLAKRLEVDNMVWFVGEQKFLRKWLDNFNLFVYTGQYLDFKGVNSVIQALNAGLPMIGPQNIGLESFVEQDKNGELLPFELNEEIARSIISFHQNKKLLSACAARSKELAEQKFSLENTVNGLTTILK